jgi:hypothetical protein
VGREPLHGHDLLLGLAAFGAALLAAKRQSVEAGYLPAMWLRARALEPYILVGNAAVVRSKRGAFDAIESDTPAGT